MVNFEPKFLTIIVADQADETVRCKCFSTLHTK